MTNTRILKQASISLLTAVAGLATQLPDHTQSAATQAGSHLAQGHLLLGETLSSSGAKLVLEHATKEARRLGVGGSFAVVDRGGHLLCLERLDSTFAATPMIAYGKARTSALFEKPTRVFEELINQGRTTMVTLEGFTPLQGGIPIVVDNKVVGAIGVSGASSAKQDEELALVGAMALSGKP